MTGFELEGERPMLLQVTSGGVNYNQPVNFGRGYEAEAEVTVYDTMPAWDESALEITTSRFLYRREGDRILVDKVFVIQNRSSPPRTYYDPEGTFRFNMPTDKLAQMNAITASSALGVPVPQQASPLPDASGWVTKTAFKPGETQMAVSYEVEYENDSWEAAGQAFLPLPELLVFYSPPDIDVTAEGWEDLGTEPEGRFAVIRKANLAPGDPIRFTLAGGSRSAPSLLSEEERGGGGGAPTRTGGTVTRIPDDTRASKWVLVVLMAATGARLRASHARARTAMMPRSEKRGLSDAHSRHGLLASVRGQARHEALRPHAGPEEPRPRANTRPAPRRLRAQRRRQVDAPPHRGDAPEARLGRARLRRRRRSTTTVPPSAPGSASSATIASSTPTSPCARTSSSTAISTAPHRDIDELLDWADLRLRERSPARSLSRGMQQRLAIARAILHEPKLLLLDEPFTGLDAVSSGRLVALLEDLKGRETTILLATHDVPTGVAVADRVLIMDSGKVVTEATGQSVDEVRRLLLEAHES